MEAALALAHPTRRRCSHAASSPRSGSRAATAPARPPWTRFAASRSRSRAPRTTVDRAVRLGQVDAHAHPRRAGQAVRRHRLDRRGRADHAQGQRPDGLRRRHIGFVFQFFNLLPMLTAEENVTLPLSISEREGELQVARGAARGDRPRRPARPPAGELSADSSGASPWHARVPADRPLRGQQAATSTRTTSAGILGLLRDAVGTYGQTTVMVTHDPRAATIADGSSSSPTA